MSRTVSGFQRLRPWYAALRTGSSLPPPACTITLTGDIAALFGGQPLDISGQTVSKTVPASPANVYAAGGAAAPVAWTGWRGVAYKASMYSTASDMSGHSLMIVDLSIPAFVQVTFNEFNDQWYIDVNGVLDVLASGTYDQKPGIRINGDTGDVEVYLGSVVKTKTDYASLGGAFLGASVQPVGVLGFFSGGNLTAGDTYSAQIYTAAADLADVGFPAGTLDWCGTEIPFSPLALPGLIGYYDITASGKLSQDTAGATPADAATDPIGRVDAVGPAGAPSALQGTAPARPLLRLEPTRSEFDLLDDAWAWTLPAISGGQVVIAGPAGIWIGSLDFAGGTWPLGPSGYTGGPAGLLSLLGGDITHVAFIDTAMDSATQDKLVAYLVGKGSAGLIAEGATLISNLPDFETTWAPGGATSISGNVVTYGPNSTDAAQRNVSIASTHILFTVRYRRIAPGATSSQFRIGGYNLADPGGTVSPDSVTASDTWQTYSKVFEVGSGTIRMQLRGLGAHTAGLQIELDPAETTIREVIMP